MSDESVLARLANNTLSGAEKVGNTLDTFGGGSSVRDLIGGVFTGNWDKYNPIDQFSAPLSSRNRTTFRDDILPDLGLMRPNKETGLSTLNIFDSKKFDPGEFARDLVGFGLDVFFDPLSWLNPLGGATKGGAAATRAGITQSDIMRTAAREFGAEGALWGPREAAMHVTPRQLVSHKMGTKQSRDVMEENLRRFAGPTDYDRPLRGSVGTGFMVNKDAVGTGSGLGKWMARKGDSIDRILKGQVDKGGWQGKAAAVPRWLHAAFNPAVGDKVGRGAQALARARYGNRKQLASEAIEELNKIKVDIAKTEAGYRSDLEQALPYLANSQSPLDSIGDMRLGDVVQAADRGNYGHVVSITDKATHVHFVNPQTGDSAIKAFPHEGVTGGVPTPSKNLAKRHSFDSKEAKELYSSALGGKIDEVLTWMAENENARGMPDFRGAIRRHMPELLRRGDRDLLRRMESDFTRITKSVRDLDDRWWSALRSYGVPTKQLPEWMEKYAVDANGLPVPTTGRHIRHVARFADIPQDELLQLNPEKSINTWTESMTGRRDVLRSLPKSLVNQLTASEKYRKGGWKSILQDKWIRPYLDADFKQWTDGPDGTRQIAPVLDDSGKVLTGAKAHAKRLHEWLMEAPEQRIFKNRMMGDFERHLRGVARAAADAKSVFEVLQDQKHWRIPRGYDSITVRAGNNLGDWDIVGYKGGKQQSVATVQDFETIQAMIGEKNASKLRASIRKNPDATFEISDTSTLPQGATNTGGMTGGSPVYKALQDAGLRTDVGEARFAREILASNIRSLDVDPEIAEAVSKAYKIFEAPDVLKQFLKTWDKMTQFFKNSVTVPFPAFAARNLGSGQVLNMAASGEVSTLKEVVSYLSDLLFMRNVMKNPEQHLDLIGELDAHDLIPKDFGFDDYQIKNVNKNSSGLRMPEDPGFLTLPGMKRAFKQVGMDMKDEALKSPGRLRDKPGISGARRAVRTAMEWGNKNNQAVEFLNRATLYRYLRKHKGYSASQAAKKVIELHFDYGDLTMVDRAIKRGVPFYTFSKKMAEAFVRSMFKNPGGPMAQGIRAQARQRNPDQPLPEHIATGTAIPLGKTGDGDEKFISGLGMAWEDPLQLLSGNSRNRLYELASRAHPIPKALLEHMTDQSFFQSGRDLDDLDPVLGRIGRNIHKYVDENAPNEPMRPVGKIAETLLTATPASRLATTVRQLTDHRRNSLDKAINLLTGVKTTIVNESARNAMIEDAATELLRESGAKEFDRVYFRPETLEAMSPEQRAKAQSLMRLLSDLAKRAKERQSQRARATAP